jgi:predicted nucleotidyltransferase
LFGSYARGKYREKQGATQGKKSDYDILVVTSGVSEAALLESTQGKFEDIDVHVQLIAEDIDLVNSNLEEGQFFFSDIKREGKILYTSGRHELAEPKGFSPTRRREIAEEDFENWFRKAAAFHVWYHDAQQRQLAAFALQQTAEMCYKAVEMVFTHYIPHEHYLGILSARAAKLDRRMNEALPRDTKEQSELFNQLDYAYIGGRYRSEEAFPVTKEQLDYWAAETKKLLDITETVCLDRIEDLKKIEQDG